MKLNDWLALGSLICGILQCIAVAIQVIQQKQISTPRSKQRVMFSPVILVNIILLVGVCISFVSSGYLYLRATTKIEGATQCPTTAPTKSGNATTHGVNSPAISGSGNAVEIVTPKSQKEANR